METPLARQLTVIRGGEQAGYFELRLKTERGMRQAFIPVDEPEAVSSILSVEAPYRDTYLGVAVRSSQKGTSSAVRACWCLWADCDTLEAAKRVDGFEIRPSLIVNSGSGVHCYWALMDPATPEQAVAMNKRLAAAFGADPVAHDVARILRPVGTLNHKHDPPAPVTLAPRACRWTHLRLLDAALPQLPEERRVPQTPRTPVDDSDDYLKTIPADEYVPRLTGRDVGRDRKAQCPFHGGGEERTPSLHVYGTTWTCYGCAPTPGAGKQHLGGGIYQLAALRLGYRLPLRGADYLNVQRDLEQLFIDDPNLRST